MVSATRMRPTEPNYPPPGRDVQVMLPTLGTLGDDMW